MTDNQPSIFSIALKYGLILGVVLIILNTISKLIGVEEGGALSYVYSILSLAAFITGLSLTVKEYKQNNDGYASFGQAFSLSALTGTIAVILTNAFRYFYIHVIDDKELRIIAERMEGERYKLEERGMSDEEIDQALSIAEMFTSPFMLLLSSIFGIILLSLLIAAIMKNKRSEFE